MKRLIAGCPRSGTNYVYHLFKEVFPELDIGFEQPGADLVVSWKHVALEEFDLIAHQVRHPLDVIGSLPTIWGQGRGGTLWPFLFKCFDTLGIEEEWPVSKVVLLAGVETHLELLRCHAFFWVQWNRAIGKRSHGRFQVEQLPMVWPRLLEYLNLPSVPFPEMEGNRNDKPHPPLDQERFKNTDKDLFEEVCRRAWLYCYEVPQELIDKWRQEQENLFTELDIK